MYLLSFLKINAFFQGTTKPTYYVKLYDDNNLTSDQEQGIGQKIMILGVFLKISIYFTFLTCILYLFF